MCPARAPTAFLGAGGCLHYRRTRKTLSTPPFEKSTNTRVGLSLIRRKFDIVMAWSVDRLGRPLQDLIGFLSELHSLGIDLALHQQGIDTTTPAGKAMFQMMGVFAEFERAMIRERVNAGIARAKAGGKHCGRPFIDTKLEGRIRDALAAPGRPGLHKIAKQFGVGTGTVQRIAHAN
jgi:DNA invertase Pin-like site-specific DNA recombinase